MRLSLNDKIKALELLGKHLGMFTGKFDINGDVEQNVIIDYDE